MYVVSGGRPGKIRRWRTENGKEVGTPMDAGGTVYDIAVSQDGKWVVSVTQSGLVTVWNAESHSKVTEWKAHHREVRGVDVSPDGTRIASGSEDKTLCVWSLSTGERLLDPLQHDQTVVVVKISPNGRLIATGNPGVRIYDSRNGDLLVEFPVHVNSGLNQSLAWARDSKQLFALSSDGTVYCLDVPTGKALSKWAIHSDKGTMCIALASNGTFITVSANSSVSFWDTTTHEQIGSVIEHTHDVLSMGISSNYDLVTGGDKRITLRGLCDILPSRYFDNVRVSA
jgi:WD40 repeat protein